MTKPHLLLGEAGKYRVAAELLKRGIPVFFPACDDGIDLIAGEHRLQIKTCRFPRSHRIKDGQPKYRFNFIHWSTRHVHPAPKLAHLNEKVTHVICWGVDDDLFWVIPAETVRGKSCLSLLKDDGMYRCYLQAWEQLIHGAEQR